MRYVITHQGVPIGEAELEVGPDLTVGVLHATRAIAAILPLIRASSEQLALLGFPHETRLPAPIVPRRLDALARAAALGRALELRRADGSLVPTDFVELIEGALIANQITVWVRARSAASQIAAIVVPEPRVQFQLRDA